MKEDDLKALQIVLAAATPVMLDTTLDLVEDEGDNVILATADEDSCSLIVSGDRDLLSIDRWQGINIVTPKEFIDRK